MNTLEQIPDLYRQILRDAVAPYRDPDLAEKNQHALKAWRDQLRAVIREEVEAALPREAPS